MQQEHERELAATRGATTPRHTHARRPHPPGPRQRAHALRRAGADPLDVVQQPLPRPPDQLRPAGELPRHRPGLPARQGRGSTSSRSRRSSSRPWSPSSSRSPSAPAPAVAASGSSSGSFDLRAAAALAQPDGHLRAHRRDPDGARPGGRHAPSRSSRRSRPTGSTSSAASPASPRFAALSFLRLPPLGWGLVGAGAFVVLLGGRLQHRAPSCPPSPSPPSSSCSAPSRSSAPSSGRPTTRCTPPTWPAGSCASRSTTPRCRPRCPVDGDPAQLAVLPLPLHLRRLARRRPRHRRRHRQRRRRGARRRAPSGSTPSRSTPRSCSSAATTTPTGPTPTRG